MAGCIGLVLLASCSSSGGASSARLTSTTRPPAGHVVQGAASLVNHASTGAVGAPCTGTGEYSDFVDGAQVVVEDEAHRTIATGSLVKPQLVGSGLTCAAGLVVFEVPRARFYTFKVGDHASRAYEFGELEALGWAPNFVVDLVSAGN